jgi:hypothetical protein
MAWLCSSTLVIPVPPWHQTCYLYSSRPVVLVWHLFCNELVIIHCLLYCIIILLLAQEGAQLKRGEGCCLHPPVGGDTKRLVKTSILMESRLLRLSEMYIMSII